MWLEAEKQLLEGLIKLLNTGGEYALWGIAMWLGFELIKIFLIGGFIWACIRLITRSVMGICVSKSLLKTGAVSLLGEKVAKHVSDALTDFSTQCSVALNTFAKEASPAPPPNVATESTEQSKTSNANSTNPPNVSV